MKIKGVKMKILKKAAALIIAAAISLSPITAAYAQSNESAVIDETHNPEPTIDISDADYKPIDKTKFVKWNVGDKPAENTKYYIDGTVKIPSNKVIEFPKGSTLVVCEGADLGIYAGTSLIIDGTLIIEPKARVTLTGKLTIKQGAGFANYGTVVSTTKGIIRISSDAINHGTGTMILSGVTYIYNSGSFINRGQVTFAKKSVTAVTGNFSTTEEARIFLKGVMRVTINGTVSLNGYFSLIGELEVSGKLFFEKNVRYYRVSGSTLSASKSARIVDYRGDGNGAKPDLFSTGMKGIDVSSWQDAIDWKKVKNSGVKYAMIRASFSDDKVDKTFDYNIVEAAKVGINVGVYHYCYALDAEEAKAEARHFIKTISPYKITYPVVLDLEDITQANLDKETINEIAQAFIKEIRSAGYYPMIYSYTNWYDNYMDMKALGCEVWVAHWDVPQPSYKGSYGIWQYSSKGLVSGIDGYVDLNACFKDYEKIIRDGGYNHLDRFD